MLCTLSASVRHTLGLTPDKFLIVSAPRDGKIAYMRVQRGGNLLSATKALEDKTKALISSGLVHPQGLAVDQLRKALLVADPDAQKIYSYPLTSKMGELSAGAQTVLASGVEARWVAVDGVGNIFFTDEPRNQILKIAGAQVAKGNATPSVVYDGTSSSEVSSPGGLATDGFHAYWVNKQLGSQVGSVVRASETPKVELPSLVTLAKNSDKSYGLCLALNNVYYTQPESVIFAVKKTGGNIQKISDRFTNPRGCAWDGDSTVYVADRGANAVYSFSGNMRELSAVQLTKTVDFEDAFGVAVFSAARRGQPLLAAWGAALVALVAAAQGLFAAGAVER